MSLHITNPFHHTDKSKETAEAVPMVTTGGEVQEGVTIKGAEQVGMVATTDLKPEQVTTEAEAPSIEAAEQAVAAANPQSTEAEQEVVQTQEAAAMAPEAPVENAQNNTQAPAA